MITFYIDELTPCLKNIETVQTQKFFALEENHFYQSSIRRPVGT